MVTVEASITVDRINLYQRINSNDENEPMNDAAAPMDDLFYFVFEPEETEIADEDYKLMIHKIRSVSKFFRIPKNNEILQNYIKQTSSAKNQRTDFHRRIYTL